jgi:hypothetical protein
MNKYSHFSKASTDYVLARVSGSARMCISKKTYATLEKAEEAVVAVEAKYGNKMRAYECPHCYKYHLTRVKERALI